MNHSPIGDHPHVDPGDGRTECYLCGKFVREVLHSCKGVPVTPAAEQRVRTLIDAVRADERARLLDDLNTPCTHGNSPVSCVPCLNDACYEGAVLAELEEDE